MASDGDSPLSEALTDAAQKGAAVAAVVMQVLAEQRRIRKPEGGSAFERAARTAERAANRQPPQMPVRAEQDYLVTMRRWAPAFEPAFANSDPRTAATVWIEATRHAQLYPSAREALPLADRRLRALDPRLMDRVDRRLAEGAGPLEALQSAAQDQALRLPPGRGLQAQLAAAELELERVRITFAREAAEAWADHEAEKMTGGGPAPNPSDLPLFRAEARVQEELEASLNGPAGQPAWRAPYVVHVFNAEGPESTHIEYGLIGAADIASQKAALHHITEVFVVDANGRYVARDAWQPIIDKAVRANAATAEAPHLPSAEIEKSRYSIVAFDPAAHSPQDMPSYYESHVTLTAAADRARLFEDDGFKRVEIHDDATGRPIPRSAWDGADLASVRTSAQARALEGLSADEEHAGLLMKGAVDNPATPANERIDGLVESGERFQVAEASTAHAASLTSLSYPHSVEATMAAVRTGPTPRTSAKPAVVQDRKRGLSV